MSKLEDYSGDLVPGLKLEDFSPRALAGLVKLYAKLYIAMDGFWYLTLKERLGDKEALACDIAVWEKNTRYDVARLKRQLKIRGRDVASLMKIFQLCPWCMQMEYDIDIRDEDNAVFTTTRCPTLDALEAEGKGREAEICRVVEPVIMQGYASALDPDIEVKCLEAPPRESKDDICCQWQFTRRVWSHR